MAHHGWVSVLDPRALTPTALVSPFGRLFPSADHTYDSLSISLLAGAKGPIELHGFGKAGLGAGATNPAGFTFLGQFIDHDLTEFRAIGDDFRLLPVNPTLGQRQRVLEDGQPTATNGRIPTLDLDSVYGLLGVVQPDLFDPYGMFLLNDDTDGSGNPVTPAGRDIQRSKNFRNNRLIADPRNDENKLVVQIHLLFEFLHNKIHAAKSTSDKAPGSVAFQATRRTVQNAYRRIVLHDYLPRIVQEKHRALVLQKLATHETFYQRMNKRAEEAFLKKFPHINRADLKSKIHPEGVLAMPVEFAHAAFRLGHSQLLASYNINRGDARVPLFSSKDDLRGDTKLDTNTLVDWHFFFEDSKGAARQHGAPIDANLATGVFRLPPPTIGEPPLSLAERNIRRGVDFGLPSGQEAASYLTAVYGSIAGLNTANLFPRPEFVDDFSEILDREHSLAWATPLWYYILREAGLYDGGPQLGTVGGLIVAETILGSLNAIDNDEFDLQAEAKDPNIASGAATATPGSPDEIKSMTGLLLYLGLID